MRLLLQLSFCVFFCLVSFCQIANAQQTDAKIFGLSIVCERCEVRQDPCVLLLDSVSYSCDEGLLKLLRETQSGPTYSEIRKYLSDNNVSKEVFNELLRLLEVTNFELSDDSEQLGIVENFIKNADSEIKLQSRLLLKQALEQVIYSRFESSRRVLVREENLQTLDKFNLQKVLSLLTAKSAYDAIVQAEVERAQWLVSKSKSIYTATYEERDLILAELEEHPLLKQKSVMTVAKEEIKQINKKVLDPKKLKLFVILSGALILVFSISIYFFIKKPKEKPKVKEPKLVKKSKSDLKIEEILKFFDLDENSTEEDLNRNYRKMAKAVHPDVAAKNLDYDFHKLQDMFEQARRIVFKLK